MQQRLQQRERLRTLPAPLLVLLPAEDCRLGDDVGKREHAHHVERLRHQALGAQQLQEARDHDGRMLIAATIAGLSAHRLALDSGRERLGAVGYVARQDCLQGQPHAMTLTLQSHRSDLFAHNLHQVEDGGGRGGIVHAFPNGMGGELHARFAVGNALG